MPRIPRHPSRSDHRSEVRPQARADARPAAPARWRQWGKLLLLGGATLACLGELARHMGAS